MYINNQSLPRTNLCGCGADLLGYAHGLLAKSRLCIDPIGMGPRDNSQKGLPDSTFICHPID
jgi:hypothetical protein